jgi:4-amino-4-deoxy-L-arabinose transferase-like glycosyltransferase
MTAGRRAPASGERMRRVTAVAVATMLAAAAIAAFQLRAAYRTLPVPDSIAYFEVADQISEVGYGRALPLHWSPLYPLYLAAVRRVTRFDVSREVPATNAADALLLVLMCATVALAFRGIARLCWRDDHPSALAWMSAGGGLVLFLAFGVLRVGLRLPDALVATFAVAMVWAWCRSIARGLSPWWALAAGALGALGYLSRSNLLYWSAAVAAVACVVAPRVTIARRLAAFALFAAGLAVVAAPHVLALSTARGTWMLGESGKIVFSETYGAQWPSGTFSWPLQKSGGDVLVFTETHEVNFPGFYDPGRQYDDAVIPFRWRAAVAGILRSIQSTLLGYWTSSFALLWPLLWALWPIALFGPGPLRRPPPGYGGVSPPGRRIACLLAVAGLGGLTMHVISFSIGYYLPAYLLLAVPAANLVVLDVADDDASARARRRALHLVGAGFALAAVLSSAALVRHARQSQVDVDNREAQAMAAALRRLPSGGAPLRKVAVVGGWLGLYGIRLSQSQVYATIPDPAVVADRNRFARAVDALRRGGVIAVLARRQDVPIGSDADWTPIRGASWAVLDLARSASR